MKIAITILACALTILTGCSHSCKGAKCEFDHRQDLEVQRSLPTPPLRIAITGSSGLVGSALSDFFRRSGHTVIPLVRQDPKEGEALWSPATGEVETDKLEGVDGVIHLAGENIASGRWTEAKKRRIEDSRVVGTALLVESLNSLEAPPRVLISASAVGYYGMQSHEVASESTEAGDDFLAQVCRKWESEAKGFTKGRLVITRFGIVLSPNGGALQKMLTPFKLGLGGKVGSGQQLISWVSIDDLCYQVYRLLLTPSIEGPVNLCSPQPVTNCEFSYTLAKVLCRPCFVPLPAFMARLVFGEMADATILSSIGAKPHKLEEAGLPFYHPDLSSALNHLLRECE